MQRRARKSFRYSVCIHSTHPQLEEAVKTYQKALQLHQEKKWAEAERAYISLLTTEVIQERLSKKVKHFKMSLTIAWCCHCGFTTMSTAKACTEELCTVHNGRTPHADTANSRTNAPSRHEVLRRGMLFYYYPAHLYRRYVIIRMMYPCGSRL